MPDGDLEFAAKCATTGISVTENIDQLVDHILHGSQEATLRHAFEVVYHAGHMDACGAEVETGDTIRHAYELVGKIPIGRWSERNEDELLESVVHLADSMDAITAKLSDTVMERNL